MHGCALRSAVARPARVLRLSHAAGLPGECLELHLGRPRFDGVEQLPVFPADVLLELAADLAAEPGGWRIE